MSEQDQPRERPESDAEQHPEPHHDDDRRDARTDDDSPVERYRDSPGIGLFSDDPPAEPNEPG